MAVPKKHKEGAPASVKCAVITISDSRTAQTDESGKLIRDLFQKSGHSVLFTAVVKDEPKAILDAVEQASWTCEAIVTNGGTGLSNRDVTIPTLFPHSSESCRGSESSSGPSRTHRSAARRCSPGPSRECTMAGWSSASPDPPTRLGSPWRS